MKYYFTEERAKVLSSALFKAMHILKESKDYGLFSVSSSSYAEHIMLDIIERISNKERIKFMIDLVSNADVNTLPWIATVINMIELGYGRLAANGNEHDYKKIITVDELQKLENIFVTCTKEFLDKNGLFEFEEWRMIYHLMNSFDPEFMKEYIGQYLMNELNILHFMENFISAWTGSGTEYEIQDSYQEYFSKEKVLETINNCVKNKSFFTLPIEIQRKNASFYLYSAGKDSGYGNIPQFEADEQIKNGNKIPYEFNNLYKLILFEGSIQDKTCL